MNKYKTSFKISISILFVLGITDCLAEERRPPQDNDETYKLPIYSPVARPGRQKIIFNNVEDDDEVYRIPPPSETPEQTYQRQYEKYQSDLKEYNKAMEEYKKALAARQATQIDNDSSYVLPNQYKLQPATKTLPKPQPEKTAPSTPQYQYQYDYYDQKQVKPKSNSDDSSPFPYYYY